ncbi:hypothetical protein AA23498_1166 [Acetobacter nitrogenifigens DSM 23921 = NBRC 105050]|uniref:Gluconolaconase n=1 Tax=Acetobacter nitrogenifigens DSM 23921 = NBRC 105050 TaxID=1120919 RepID=A0A511XAG2_9PROT|nr:L-dopachrome tautomerase-related protein [Acetobacter nitrogenifigens]GBQ91371.1 hypothetical protein AA23498_1166 [Acetobacter nitrogenifigens DSM 23921 = NBRC 105050]GEN59905.1 hypothetical protein ANI02nite_17890 [Acetobacter nitrogenifigens DSM 23921 = NBRC 105050]
MKYALRLLTSLVSIASIPAAAAPHSGMNPMVEQVAALSGAMPTGVTVAPNGRIFLNYPQWGDHPRFAVGELKDGHVVPYPDEILNIPDTLTPDGHFLSVQSVVADGANRLWVLDTGAPGFSSPVAGGTKLVAIDMGTNKVVQTIVLGPDVVLPTTYLNDVRFDLRQGKSGVAYITDSSIKGPGGLIVVDLASGHSLRRLSGHSSTMPDRGFVPRIDGQPLMLRPRGAAPGLWRVASDGIALSPDGATLYYCALSSRHFYAVPTALLRDPHATDEMIAAEVRDLGPKAPSDGLAEDDRGAIYAGDYEHGSIRKFVDGRWTTIAHDPRILWPDTLSIGPDGYLYFTANQLYRQPVFHEGKDLRRQPYTLLRIKIDAGPVVLH